MKLLVAMCFFTLVGLTLAIPHPGGCIWIEGRCSELCEDGTHDYTTGCGPLLPEATCDNPNPVPDTSSNVCDFSACYCDSPTVRDTVSNKCMPLDKCPKKEVEKKEEEKKEDEEKKGEENKEDEEKKA